jgi:protease I
MRIACTLSTDFEDSQFGLPYRAFREAGHDVVVVGAQPGEEMEGLHGEEKAEVALGIEFAHPDEFDALFIPGGYSPDHLRADPRFLEFTRAFADANKPLLAICHGPQLLSSADAIRGRRLTAWRTVQQDLERMGERVPDADLVVDGQLVTSRQPADLDGFIIESLRILSGMPAIPPPRPGDPTGVPGPDDPRLPDEPDPRLPERDPEPAPPFRPIPDPRFPGTAPIPEPLPF